MYSKYKSQRSSGDNDFYLLTSWLLSYTLSQLSNELILILMIIYYTSIAW